MDGLTELTYPATAVVTFSDGSTRDVAVNVTVKALSTFNEPTTQDKVYNQRDTVRPLDFITNKDALPEGTIFEWNSNADTIDAITTGDKVGKIKVTYIDGSVDVVTVHAKVNNLDGSETDAAKANVITVPQTVDFGTPAGSIDLEKFIDTAKSTGLENRTDAAPWWKEAPDTTPDNKTDADKVDPNEPSPTEVDDTDHLTPDEKEEVKDKVEDANKDKFPPNTNVEIGDDGTATITYPDGSQDVIPGSKLVAPKSTTSKEHLTLDDKDSKGSKTKGSSKTAKPMADHKSAGAVAESKSKKSTLQQTGERKSDLSILAGSMAMLLGLASLFIGRKKKKDEN